MATFTLPRGLRRRLARSHPKIVYDLFFHASQLALQKLAADRACRRAGPKYIGGTLGMTGVLQTWTRDQRC